VMSWTLIRSGNEFVHCSFIQSAIQLYFACNIVRYYIATRYVN